MPEPVEIVAIEGRTEEWNGVSRPFQCIDASDARYFVKLRNVGCNELIKEWLVGRLAHEMNLPAAEVHQVVIPAELVTGNAEYEADLGHGIGFGSLEVDPAERLTMAALPEDHSDEGLSRILLFDRWTRNVDRALSPLGGNPNLLLGLRPRRVVMIDHDNALDAHFDASYFWELHALREFRAAWQPGRREEMLHWLDSGAARLETLWTELPEEWLVDAQGDRRCSLDMPAVKTLLSSPRSDPDFWTIPAP